MVLEKLIGFFKLKQINEIKWMMGSDYIGFNHVVLFTTNFIQHPFLISDGDR